ncbi:MAG: bifunctional diaminohydroxyphosphoribosylaminopyrimidine deaminase/5-amino-6-(5-phosphoribosylamino)uracil reductase RibD [Paracoccaceae bacterium]
MSDTDLTFMNTALTLGRRGLGNVWPNPAVGCVLVRAGHIVGRGWTQPGGRPHAETMALAAAGSAAQGATAYVTLEPCSHQGQTGPCAQALIDASIKTCVVATRDPDPRVSGRGIEMLQNAGIVVREAVHEPRARKDHLGFLSRITTGRPMVTLKLASSFDGRIATASGHSQWITGPLARRAVHMMRANHDAVLVGAGTARQDDPSLTVRDLGMRRQPVRVVVSRRLDVPLTGNLARSAAQIPVWLCHGHDADPELMSTWTGLGARLVACDTHLGKLDLRSVFKSLGDLGLTRVFCEGGGQLAASLLDVDLVDELVGFTAGLGIGAEGLASLGALGLDRLDQAPRFVLEDVRRIGPDIQHRWSHTRYRQR